MLLGGDGGEGVERGGGRERSPRYEGRESGHLKK